MVGVALSTGSPLVVTPRPVWPTMRRASRALLFVVTTSGLTTMFWVLRLATPVRAWTTPPASTLMLFVGVVRLVLAASNWSRPPALTLIDPPAPTAPVTPTTPVPLTTLLPFRDPALLALYVPPVTATAAAELMAAPALIVPPVWLMALVPLSGAPMMTVPAATLVGP